MPKFGLICHVYDVRSSLNPPFHPKDRTKHYLVTTLFSFDDIKKHDFVLIPGRYVGAADQKEDSEPFTEKMTRLTAQLKEQFEESDRLEGEIKKNLAGLGYDFN